MYATAFAPGHITGFFQAYHHKDIRRCGSIGAGINLKLGATATARTESSEEQRIKIMINGDESEACVTRQGVKNLIGSTPLDVIIDITLDLPVKQGYGMSAAGTLASTLAISKILSLPPEKALEASHIAEITCKTGLGDIVSSYRGGIELRVHPGLPHYGSMENIPSDINVVLCTIGTGMKTQDILADPKKMQQIQTFGKDCIEQLMKKPTVKNLMIQSQRFTINTGLAQEKTLEAINSCSPYGIASMCMLGNSVFAIGKTPELERALSAFGVIETCEVDQDGARLL